MSIQCDNCGRFLGYKDDAFSGSYYTAETEFGYDWLCRRCVSDSDGTATAAQCEDIAVPEGLPSAGLKGIAR